MTPDKLTDPVRISRLRWKCRRGMKELDILLETFVETNRDSLATGSWPEFESLLEMEDDLLWDCLRQPGATSPAEFSELIREIHQSQRGHA